MSRTFCAAMLLLAAGMIGCNGSKEGQVPVYPVSGTVKMFGSPLAGATVAFAPQEKQPTAVGTTDAQGNFQLTTYDFGDGAAVGRYKVVVSKAVAAAAQQEGGAKDAHGDAYESTAAAQHAAQKSVTGTAMVPAQYTSSADTPLTAEVKAEDNVINFEIK